MHTACPGDKYWSVYKHGGVEPPYMPGRMRRFHKRACIADVALLGTQAICLEISGQVLFFDVTEMTWGRRRMAPCPGWSEGDCHFLVASHGKVVLVSRRGTAENAFRLFRLDIDALEWSQLGVTGSWMTPAGFFAMANRSV